MSLDVTFSPEADEDLAEAYRWYEERRPGLGDEFLLCVDAVVGLARRQPEHFAPVYLDVRRGLLRRFPYGVFYVVEPERLYVLAVYHSSRDPAGWQGRRPSTTGDR